MLEAGCGLGQYVLLLRERGHAALGADWSLDAVRAGARAGAPVSVMDLRALAVRHGGVAAYLSLGVVEHDPDGPDAILEEAARVVPPGGWLLLSVPYWNGVRRLGAPYLAARPGSLARPAASSTSTRSPGASWGAWAAHGFTVRSFHPYDPARVLRGALRRRAAARARGAGARRSRAARADRRAPARRPRRRCCTRGPRSGSSVTCCSRSRSGGSRLLYCSR